MPRGLRLLFLLLPLGAAAQGLDAARTLQKQGALREAQKAYEALLPQFRGKDPASLASALSGLGQIALAQGDYDLALTRTNEAKALFRTIGDFNGEMKSLNSSGAAQIYRADYPAALRDFDEALAIARAHGNGEIEVDVLNNIGSIHYLRASYLDALRAYRAASATIEISANQPWSAHKRAITVANTAQLFLRLGQEQQALQLYRDLGKDSQSLTSSEQARLLINQGVLFRRLEDPQKALETYSAASAILSKEGHRDAEIGVLKNIGIVQALDLNNLPAALQAFTEALKLAEQAGNKREVMQARLYLGETQLLRNDNDPAQAEFAAALTAAKALDSTDEQWKALYGLGRALRATGHDDLAAARFRESVAVIESSRAKLQLPSLKTDFLSDKREVYDALIELTLPSADSAAVFDLLERSRARNFQDRLGETQPTLPAVQARLDKSTLLLELWVGPKGKAAVLWITSSAAKIVRIAAPGAELTQLLREVSSGSGEAWKALASSVGDGLLASVEPLSQKELSQLVVVPDGQLSQLPFDVLAPLAGPPLVERFAISYLPSASLLLRETPRSRSWSLPWKLQLLAFADPRIGNAAGQTAADALAGPELQSLLPASGDEARAIARTCTGRSELHLGSDDLKRYLTAAPAVPLLHLATHATADLTSPERSRILFSPAAAGDRADYLFLKEVYGLDLRGVDLAILSACDTERGKSIRGEGVQGFGRALLAAGARSSITALWRVADEPSREFMQQLYYELNHGAPKAEALRTAKLSFLRSSTLLRHPRFWAPFVLNGDGQHAIPRVLPWSYLLGAAGAIAVVVLILVRRRTA